MNVLRDISVIILAAGAFIFTLIPLVVSGAVVYGVWRLRRHRNLPTWLRRAREILMKASSAVETAMEMATRPIFAVHTAFATVGGWLRVLTERGGE